MYTGRANVVLVDFLHPPCHHYVLLTQASHWLIPPDLWRLIGPMCLTWGWSRGQAGGSADNVKTAAFFVCDFYKI